MSHVVGLLSKKILMTIKAQLVLVGEGTDFIFLHRRQNTISPLFAVEAAP